MQVATRISPLAAAPPLGEPAVPETTDGGSGGSSSGQTITVIVPELPDPRTGEMLQLAYQYGVAFEPLVSEDAATRAELTAVIDELVAADTARTTAAEELAATPPPSITSRSVALPTTITAGFSTLGLMALLPRTGNRIALLGAAFALPLAVGAVQLLRADQAHESANDRARTANTSFDAALESVRERYPRSD